MLRDFDACITSQIKILWKKIENLYANDFENGRI